MSDVAMHLLQPVDGILIKPGTSTGPCMHHCTCLRVSHMTSSRSPFIFHGQPQHQPIHVLPAGGPGSCGSTGARPCDLEYSKDPAAEGPMGTGDVGTRVRVLM